MVISDVSILYKFSSIQVHDQKLDIDTIYIAAHGQHTGSYIIAKNPGMFGSEGW